MEEATVSSNPIGCGDNNPGSLILIVDDNRLTLKVVSALLTRHNHDVRTAPDAEQALELLGNLRPGLILVDIQLPGMSGYELVGRLRARREFDRIALVAFTALASPDEGEKALASGCDGYISKPVDPRTFPAIVNKYLQAGCAIREEPDAGPEAAVGEACLRGMKAAFIQDGLNQLRAWAVPARAAEDPQMPGGDLDLEQVRTAAHRWAGLAGTLGFGEITLRARAVENLLDGADTDGGDLMPELMHLSELFATARESREPAPVPSAVVSNPLAGQRVALIGLEPSELVALSAAIERADAFSRSLSPECVLASPGCLHAFDVLVCKAPGTDGSELLRAVSAADVPQVRLGWPEGIAGRINGSACALSAENGPDEILLRASMLLERKNADLPSARADGEPTVVIIDDDPIAASFVSNALRSYASECQIAGDGQSALRIISTVRPHLIVLDVNIPSPNGFQVLDLVKRDKATRDAQVLLVTGRQRQADIMEGFRLGADDYMIKPFTALELVARLGRLNVRRKLQLIRSESVPGGRDVVFNTDELSAYVRGELSRTTSGAIRNASIHLGEGVITLTALVDFKRLPRPAAMLSNPFLAGLVTGEHQLQLLLSLSPAEGAATPLIEEVVVAGKRLEPDVLACLVPNFIAPFSRTIEVGQPWQFPHRIRRIDVTGNGLRVGIS
jgi:DNA-binding response OmpR family regulator